MNEYIEWAAAIGGIAVIVVQGLRIAAARMDIDDLEKNVQRLDTELRNANHKIDSIQIDEKYANITRNHQVHAIINDFAKALGYKHVEATPAHWEKCDEPSQD